MPKMCGMRMGALALLLVLAPACAASEKAAARDPMRCERDPTCAKARASYADCYKQCVDDPACVDRCQQIQAGTDRTGKP